MDYFYSITYELNGEHFIFQCEENSKVGAVEEFRKHYHNDVRIIQIDERENILSNKTG